MSALDNIPNGIRVNWEGYNNNIDRDHEVDELKTLDSMNRFREYLHRNARSLAAAYIPEFELEGSPLVDETPLDDNERIKEPLRNYLFNVKRIGIDYSKKNPQIFENNAVKSDSVALFVNLSDPKIAESDMQEKRALNHLLYSFDSVNRQPKIEEESKSIDNVYQLVSNLSLLEIKDTNATFTLSDNQIEQTTLPQRKLSDIKNVIGKNIFSITGDMDDDAQQRKAKLESINRSIDSYIANGGKWEFNFSDYQNWLKCLNAVRKFDVVEEPTIGEVSFKRLAREYDDTVFALSAIQTITKEKDLFALPISSVVQELINMEKAAGGISLELNKKREDINHLGRAIRFCQKVGYPVDSLADVQTFLSNFREIRKHDLQKYLSDFDFFYKDILNEGLDEQFDINRKRNLTKIKTDDDYFDAAALKLDSLHERTYATEDFRTPIEAMSRKGIPFSPAEVKELLAKARNNQPEVRRSTDFSAIERRRLEDLTNEKLRGLSDMHLTEIPVTLDSDAKVKLPVVTVEEIEPDAQIKTSIKTITSILNSLKLLTEINEVEGDEVVQSILTGDWYRSNSVFVNDLHLMASDTKYNLLDHSCLVKTFRSEDGSIEVVLNMTEKNYPGKNDDFAIKIINRKIQNGGSYDNTIESVELIMSTNTSDVAQFYGRDRRQVFVVNYRTTVPGKAKANTSHKLVFDLVDGSTEFLTPEMDISKTSSTVNAIKKLSSFVPLVRAVSSSNRTINMGSDFGLELSRSAASCKNEPSTFMAAMIARVVSEAQTMSNNK